MATRESAPKNGVRAWFGYRDYEFAGPDGVSLVSLPYVREPPQGDSLHKVLFSSNELPGFAWGSGLAWSPCGRYVLFDYSPDRLNLTRETSVLDLVSASFCSLPQYLNASRLEFSNVFVSTGQGEAVAYVFTG